MNRNPTTNTVYTSCRLTQKEARKSIITRKGAAPNKGRIKKDEKKQRNFLGRESNKQIRHNTTLHYKLGGGRRKPTPGNRVCICIPGINLCGGTRGSNIYRRKSPIYKQKSKASIYFSLYKPRTSSINTSNQKKRGIISNELRNGEVGFHSSFSFCVFGLSPCLLPGFVEQNQKLNAFFFLSLPLVY